MKHHPDAIKWALLAFIGTAGSLVLIGLGFSLRWVSFVGGVMLSMLLLAVATGVIYSVIERRRHRRGSE